MIKLVIIFCVAISVRATVIVNIYDDDDDKALNSLHGCNSGECDQHCSRYGFSGACDGDKCKCDILHPMRARQAERSQGGCNYQICDQVCRRFGFHGGSCVEGKCKCNGLTPATIQNDTLDISAKSSSSKVSSLYVCNEYACNNACKAIGHKGGFCSDNECYCWQNQGGHLVHTKQSLSGTQSVDGCNNGACNNLCKRLGFPGGSCLGDKCNCRTKQGTGEALDFSLKSPSVKVSSDDTCDNAFCHDACKALGYKKGGFCNGTDCYCWINEGKDEALGFTMKSLSNEAPLTDVCISQDCNHFCKSIGYIGGFCSGNQCYCWKNNVQGGHLVHTKQSLSGTQSVDGCNNGACNNLCKRLGFPGGSCLGDKCNCWTKQGTGEALGFTMKSLSNEAPLSAVCISQACNDLCKSIGYKGGFCSGSQCYCWKNNVQASKVESCNYRACDQLCRRLGFTGGACVGDKCKCDNFEPLPVKGDLLNYLLLSPSKRGHSVDGCNNGACNDLCKRLGFPGGSCLGDKCNCRSKQGTDAASKSYNDVANDMEQSLDDNKSNDDTRVKDLAESWGMCNNVDCVFQCIDMHYIGGRCIGDSCICV